MAEHNILGQRGEDEAARFLQKQGYIIRDRNWRFERLELDIVAEKEGTLVVVEVKSRRDTRYGLPQDAVSEQKIRHIVASADAYVRQKEIDLPIRFDVICVTGRASETLAVEHIEDAFYPPIW